MAENNKKSPCVQREKGGHGENWGVRPVGGVTVSLAVCTVAGHWNPDKAVNEARRRKCCLGGRDAAGSLGGPVLPPLQHLPRKEPQLHPDYPGFSLRIGPDYALGNQSRVPWRFPAPPGGALCAWLEPRETPRVRRAQGSPLTAPSGALKGWRRFAGAPGGAGMWLSCLAWPGLASKALGSSSAPHE